MVSRERLAAYRGLGGYGTLGREIVMFLLIGLLGGDWLDGRFGTAPVLFWVGLGFGVAGSVRMIQKALRSMRREAEREEREQGNPEPLFDAAHARAEQLRDAEFRRLHEAPEGDDARANKREEAP